MAENVGKNVDKDVNEKSLRGNFALKRAQKYIIFRSRPHDSTERIAQEKNQQKISKKINGNFFPTFP
jgi:hypothetical protein